MVKNIIGFLISDLSIKLIISKTVINLVFSKDMERIEVGILIM